MRIVGVQGIAQLLTATAAIRYHESLGGKKHSNVLLIYDVGFEREDALAKKITCLAQKLGTWAAIHFLKSDMISGCAKTFIMSGDAHTSEELMRKLGIFDVQEIFLPRNWQLANRLLMMLNKRALKVCYGDAGGIFFPSGYFAVPRGFSRLRAGLSGLMAVFRQVGMPFPRKVVDESRIASTSFDFGYFTFPCVLGFEPDMPYDVVPRDIQRGILASAAALYGSSYFEELSRKAESKGVLVTSNFSEQSVISRSNEMRAYVEWLKKGLVPRTDLLLKPHPRDSRKKIDALLNALRREGIVVRLVTQIDEPVEVLILLHQLQKTEVSVFCVSSACFSIKGFLNISPQVGFGEEIVRKTFVSNVQEVRLRHEADLRSGLAEL